MMGDSPQKRKQAEIGQGAFFSATSFGPGGIINSPHPAILFSIPSTSTVNDKYTTYTLRMLT